MNDWFDDECPQNKYKKNEMLNEHLNGFKGQKNKILNTEKRMLAKEKNTRNW